MSKVMKGVGLAHILAEALNNAPANHGEQRDWTVAHVNQLTTRDGKVLLGQLLDVLRGDARIVPVERIIREGDVQRGDTDVLMGDKSNIVAMSRPSRPVLVTGQFEIWGLLPIGCHDAWIDQIRLLPRFLLNKELPGIALRDFLVRNPHHNPFPNHYVFFWGTVCKNDRFYYVPGITPAGEPWAMQICYYHTTEGVEVLEEIDPVSHSHIAAAFA